MVSMILFIFLGLIPLGAMMYLFILIVKALRRYIQSGEIRKEKPPLRNRWVKP